jgi:Carboxypeptidase regulatory-like domain/TonB dependent receptor
MDRRGDAVRTKNTNIDRTFIMQPKHESWIGSLVWACAFFICLLLFVSLQAKAQTLYGSVVGTVTDNSGAAVPDANVVITNTQTNDSRTVASDNGGVYTISTVPAGNYQATITKQGFQSFKTTGIDVLANNVMRVDAQLQVGVVSQTVEVQSSVAAQLQTDTADVHSEISSHALETVPQATRSYQGILNQVPGVVPPGGQLSGGTNNPSKSMQFAANGTGVQGPNIRIEGVSATNPWVQQYTSFVPSSESIQSINVVTNSPDAEQGLSGGPSVTVLLRSGSNGIHGSFYERNITNATEARSFFQSPTSKAAHLVDNDTGGWVGGPIIRDKLFYFAGYEGDYIHQGYAGIISVPTPQMLSGDLSGSPAPIYDPATGKPDGTGKTPFPGNKIPANRISNVAKIMIPYVPAPNTNLTGIVNNYSVVQATLYNLHKIDTKIDYQITPKLRVSGRYGYQPYFNQQSPFFGQFLGGSSGGWPAFSANGAGNYLQNGATLAISGSVTYLFSPTLIIDGTFGVTQPHQLLFPTMTNTKVGLDTLGIPGTNIGALPWSGGMPDFDIAGYPSSTGTTFGYSYPPLEYKDPVFEYVANVTKIKGSHNIRVGEDVVRLHMNHKEVRNTVFQFTGGVTSTPGGASPNNYNGVADYLLGLPQTTNVWFQPIQPYITLREYDFSIYARDQWQASHKLTINYGLRWEFFPVPTTAQRGIQYNNLLSDITNPTMELCGVGGNPGDCGITVSHRLFAPSLGIAYRVDDNTVVRAGYALSPTQVEMGNSGTQAFPATVEGVYNGANSYSAASTTLATGFPTIPNPVPDSHGNVPIPFGAGNVNTLPKNFRRGYIQSYNLNVQRSFGAFVAQVGYVGTHVVNQNGTVNWNYATLGGGTKSLPLNQYGITGAITAFEPANWDRYNSLQATLSRRLTNGLSMQLAYTYSKDMQGGATASLPSGGAGIEIPSLYYRNTSVTPVDRTHNFIVSSTYQLPFGKDKQFVTSGIGAMVLGGWTLNGVFYHLSGLPFYVSASNSSCNCPNAISTQLANRVKTTVAKGKVPHQALDGSSWFDPTAFAPVTTANFGTGSFNSLRGPGATEFDASVFRDFQVWERLSMQFRAEGLNVANTPHFGNPGANASSASYSNGNITALNGYSQITVLNPLGRLLDARYFRFGVQFRF